MLAFISAVKKRLLAIGRIQWMDRVCPLQPGGFFSPPSRVSPISVSPHHRLVCGSGTDELKKEKRVVRGKTKCISTRPIINRMALIPRASCDVLTQPLQSLMRCSL